MIEVLLIIVILGFGLIYTGTVSTKSFFDEQNGYLLGLKESDYDFYCHAKYGDDVNCNSYSLGINWPSTYYYELAAGSSLTEIASFYKFPENYENCYRISVTDGYDDNVASLTYDEDSSQGSNMYAIKVALKPDAEVGAVVSIDVNAYYNGGYYGSETRCEDAHIQILII